MKRREYREPLVSFPPESVWPVPLDLWFPTCGIVPLGDICQYLPTAGVRGVCLCVLLLASSGLEVSDAAQQAFYDAQDCPHQQGPSPGCPERHGGRTLLWMKVWMKATYHSPFGNLFLSVSGRNTSVLTFSYPPPS